MMVPDWTGYQKFRGQFLEVLDERYFPIEWLDERLLEGRALFISSANAAIVIEKRTFPGGASDVHGLIAAGDMREIIEILIPQAEEWGARNGCIAGVIESREGWAKALKSSGYHVHQVALRKEL